MLPSERSTDDRFDDLLAAVNAQTAAGEANARRIVAIMEEMRDHVMKTRHDVSNVRDVLRSIRAAFIIFIFAIAMLIVSLFGR